MVEVKHIQQQNDGFNWKCGAVCLEMIFNYYGIPCNQDDIWDAIKSDRPTGIGQRYALTYRLAQYAIGHGLNCTIYKADNNSWSAVLDELDRHTIPAILSVKEKKSGESHFTVFCGKEDGQFIFADPNSKKERDSYDESDINEMWSPHPEINVTGFIYLVFDGDIMPHTCMHCNREYPILVHDKTLFSNKTICPYCDRQNYAELI